MRKGGDIIPTFIVIIIGIMILLMLLILIISFLIIFFVYAIVKNTNSPRSRKDIRGKDRWFMKDHYFEFPVGTNEIHNITYHFDRMWGNINVYSDEEVVRKGFRILTILDESTGQNEIRFMVGEKEIHEVYIKVDSPLVFPLFRPYYYHIFIDDMEGETLKF